MTLILPIPDADINPAGPPDWTEHPGGNEFPEWRESIDIGAPAIGWATDSTFADETIGMFGDDLLNAEFVVWAEGKLYEIEPLRQLADRAQIVLPSAASGVGTFSPKPYPKSVAFIWPRNFSGYGRPYRINAPEVFWVYPGKKWTALTDRTFRIFGKNLSADLFSPMVVVQKGSDEPYEVTVTEQSEYELTVELPSGYAAGSYQVWVHNGSGGEYGWSNAGTFTVAASTYDYSDEFPVEDETGTDQQKIEAAIAAADSNGGGTVIFAADTYTITAQIDVPDTIKLKGAGAGQTILSASTEKHIWCTGAGVIIEDMTLQGLPISFRNVDPIARRLHITSNYTSGPISFYSASAPTQTQRQVINSVIEDCILVHEGNGITLAHTGHCIARCEFYGNYQGNVYASVGGSSATGSVTNLNAIRTYNAHNVLIEDCYASSYDAENDIPLNRFLLATYSCDTNHTYKNNVVERNGAWGETSDAETNSGETFCLHGVDGGLVGTVVSATDTTVVIDGTDIVGEDLGSSVTTEAITQDVLFAAVLSGPGKGQVRLIDSASEGGGDTTLTVSKWRIQPETGDKVAIRPRFTRILIIGNTVDSVPDGRAVDFYRSGVTLWQVSNGVIIVGNTFRNVHEGVIIHATSGGYWVHGDTHIRGNTFEDAYGDSPYPMYPKAFAQVTRNNITAHGQMYGWGCVVRDNVSTNCDVGFYCGALDYDKTTTVNATRDDTGYTAAIDVGLMQTIIENNTVTDAATDKALIYGPTANWTLFRGNTVETGQDVTGFNTGKTTSVLDEQ